MKTFVFIVLALCCIQAGNNAPAPIHVTDPALLLEAPGGSRLLTDWMNVHLTAIHNSKIPSHHQRQLAYMGIAFYESMVAGDPAYQSLAGQLNGFNVPALEPVTKDLCWQASANAALAETFRYFYSDNALTLSRIDSMEQASRKRLISEGFSETSITAGVEYGLQVAHAVIDWSKSDGADHVNDPYTVPKGPGLWEPTPPKNMPPITPALGKCRTIVKGSTDNTQPPPPLAFSVDPQSPFYKMVDDVYKSSVQKDPEKMATALFWDDYPDGKTLTSSGHWESILKTVITRMNMSLIDGARAFAALFITMNDAAIGCFKAKYTYNLLRPVTYIQKYMNHPDWNPLIVTPSHPEYPAAHATVSMSAATILTQLLGDNVRFTDNTYAYRGYKAHQFNSFIEAATEAGVSRFYGGIHYMPSIKAGYEQGSKVANNISKALVFKKS